MKVKTKLLCCILLATSVLTSARPRDYAYVLEETIWQMQRNNARADLETAWNYLHRPYRGSSLPDSIISDSIVPDIHLVNGGILHRISHMQDGRVNTDYYYEDIYHYYLHVVHGVYTNCGQPWSFCDYYYISRDGHITFNVRKYIETVLWCANVYLSPFLWFFLLLLLIRKGVKRIPSRSTEP